LTGAFGHRLFEFRSGLRFVQAARASFDGRPPSRVAQDKSGSWGVLFFAFFLMDKHKKEWSPERRKETSQPKHISKNYFFKRAQFTCKSTNKKPTQCVGFSLMVMHLRTGLQLIFSPTIRTRHLPGFRHIQKHPWMCIPQRRIFGRAMQWQVFAVYFKLFDIRHSNSPANRRVID
jgi:hypothetical protein